MQDHLIPQLRSNNIFFTGWIQYDLLVPVKVKSAVATKQGTMKKLK